MVVNATGVKAESGAQTYRAVHVEGARALAAAATAAGVDAYVHVSGIGADAKSPSPYIASKGLGEIATREVFPGADDLAAVRRLRARGRFLQPLRRSRAPPAGRAAAGRGRDAPPAGLCRRCRARRGGRSRRFGEAGRDLRAGRPASDDPARSRGSRPALDRTSSPARGRAASACRDGSRPRANSRAGRRSDSIPGC